MPGHELQAADDWVVLLDREPHPVALTSTRDGYDITVGGKTYKLASDWEPGMTHFRAHLGKRPVCVQVDRDGVGYRLFHGGGLSHVLALTSKAAALYAHMPGPKLPDSANALLSPMPGLLVSVAVQVGQEVRGGEELAVVEAMKMENVLRAERDAVIASIEAEPGDGLEVDQTILTFE
jgi:propionyl-CoA carboxylase alpha chain